MRLRPIGELAVSQKARNTMPSSQYDMNDLLTLLESEHADALSLHPGEPPVVHVKGEPHPVEGPPISPENADSLFRALADTRRIREFRSGRSIEFVYKFHGSQFRVQGRAEHDSVSIRLGRLKAQPDTGPNDEERDGV